MKYKTNPISYGLFVLTATAALIGAGGPLQAQDKKPNIVVIWGDDIGITDVSAYSRGLMGFRTPNMANAIGTEYVRADLLPGADAARVRALLRNYLDQRILFYTTRDGQQLRQINANTAQLQSELWSAVQTPAAAQPTPVVALAISGMNDVLNSQGYTQAAWWNRIPLAAWGLMAAIAMCCNLLIGYGARHAEAEGILMLVLPLLGSISFFS